MLRHLDSRFDKYLAQPDFLNRLLLLLQLRDNFDIQDIVIPLFGRLSSYNPGNVLPPARGILVNYLKTLTSVDDLRQRESSAKLLGIVFN